MVVFTRQLTTVGHVYTDVLTNNRSHDFMRKIDDLTRPCLSRCSYSVEYYCAAAMSRIIFSGQHEHVEYYILLA